MISCATPAGRRRFARPAASPSRGSGRFGGADGWLRAGDADGTPKGPGRERACEGPSGADGKKGDGAVRSPCAGEYALGTLNGLDDAGAP